jgi:hypothetical protein
VIDVEFVKFCGFVESLVIRLPLNKISDRGDGTIVVASAMEFDYTTNQV